MHIESSGCRRKPEKLENVVYAEYFCLSQRGSARAICRGDLPWLKCVPMR